MQQVLLALCVLASPAFESSPPDRPNVLILLADDLQPDGVAALGNDKLRTPHLDALVAEGTAFTNCYNQGGWHGAICVSSRAMILTGRNLWTCGGGTCGDHPLWFEAFRDAGYVTFGTGKWHNGQPTYDRCFEVRAATGPGMYHSTEVDGDAYRRPAPVDSWRPDDPTRSGHWRDVNGTKVHSSQRWVDLTQQFIQDYQARDETRPFAAFVAFHAPHDPRQAPTAYLDAHPLDHCDPPPNFVPIHPFDQGDARVRDEKLAPFPRTEAGARLHQREYWAIIDHLDAQIGRLLTTLDDAGLRKNTIIVFAGDHGLAVSRHGLLGKQNLYEHSARTPLVMSGPGVPAGRRDDALVYLHAMLATVADLTNVAAPTSVEAKSLVGTWKVEAGSPRPATIYAAYRPTLQRMVRDQRWKLIIYPDARQVQLFDLRTDPWERVNLAAEHPAIVRRLHQAMLSWMDHVDDPIDRELVVAPWTWDVSQLFGATTQPELHR